MGDKAGEGQPEEKDKDAKMGKGRLMRLRDGERQLKRHHQDGSVGTLVEMRTDKRCGECYEEDRYADETGCETGGYVRHRTKGWHFLRHIKLGHRHTRLFLVLGEVILMIKEDNENKMRFFPNGRTRRKS